MKWIYVISGLVMTAVVIGIMSDVVHPHASTEAIHYVWFHALINMYIVGLGIVFHGSSSIVVVYGEDTSIYSPIDVEYGLDQVHVEEEPVESCVLNNIDSTRNQDDAVNRILGIE